jgi:hypothetical protein
MIQGQGPEVMARRVGCVLPMLALAILVASLVPGRLVGSWSAIFAGLKAAATLQVQEPILVTILERLATFLPFGALTYREFHRRQFDLPRLAACIALFLFAGVVELAQCAIEDRHARLSDLILSLAFGAAGVQLGSWLGMRPEARKVRRLLLAALIAGNAVVTFIEAQSLIDAELDGWDCDYPLLVANELTGNRPWLGHIRGFAIYPSALSAADIERLGSAPLSRKGSELHRRGGAMAVYRFDAIREQTAPQLSGSGPRTGLLLPSRGSSTWQIENEALAVRGPIVVRSAGPARDICLAIMASKAFAVEVEVASADVAQGGPARIVSQSADILHRNFTLGEEFGRLVVRIRTPWNGENGAFLPLETEAPVLTDGWHRVVFSYARGTASLFMDGAEIAPPLPYHKMMPISEGVAIRIALIAVALFWAMGLIASILFRSYSLAVHCAQVYGAAALVPVLVAVALTAWYGYEQDRLFFAAAALAPGLGMIVGRAFADMLTWQSRAAAIRRPGC